MAAVTVLQKCMIVSSNILMLYVVVYGYSAYVYFVNVHRKKILKGKILTILIKLSKQHGNFEEFTGRPSAVLLYLCILASKKIANYLSLTPFAKFFHIRY